MNSQPAFAQEPAANLELMPQIQARLLQLAGQLDQMQTRLDRLANNVQDQGTQVEALVRVLLTTRGGDAVLARLAELTAQVGATQEQLEQAQRTLAQVATQAQIGGLERLLAENGVLTDVVESVKKLGRTQFKANALGETREQQIETALSIAREVVARREQTHELRNTEERLRLEEVRTTARGELAADLLPALDSIELALASGHVLLTRHGQELAEVRAGDAAVRRDWETAQHSPAPEEPGLQAQPASWWGRLRRSLAGESSAVGPPPIIAAPVTPPAAPPPPALNRELELATEVLEATSSWLSGLELVRERFATLLALEAVQPLPALGQPFDPRLHVAMATETRSDVPPNTVVRVLRQGYMQRQRVLRYAEVALARPPAVAESEHQPAYEEDDNHER